MDGASDSNGKNPKTVLSKNLKYVRNISINVQLLGESNKVSSIISCDYVSKLKIS